MSEVPNQAATRMERLLDRGEPWSGRVGDVRLPGVDLVDLTRHDDGRGWFLKIFEADGIAAAGGDPHVAEVFLSESHRGVVRGLHFQIPPHQHAKTVVCLAGCVLDVVVDLRRRSPTEAQVAQFHLDASAPARLHVPAGMAHGFQALLDGTVVAYVTSSGHAPEQDQGIRWDSVGVDWPLAPIVISERDRLFPPLGAFATPFDWPVPR